jgi:hypothetical protein
MRDELTLRIPCLLVARANRDRNSEADLKASAAFPENE